MVRGSVGGDKDSHSVVVAAVRTIKVRVMLKVVCSNDDDDGRVMTRKRAYRKEGRVSYSWRRPSCTTSVATAIPSTPSQDKYIQSYPNS